MFFLPRFYAAWLAAALVTCSLSGGPLRLEDRTFDGNPPARLVLTAEHCGSVIRRCVFKNMSMGAITLDGADDVLIEDCHFENIRAGVPNKDTHAINIPVRGRRITIRRCIFTDIGADGIQLGHRGEDLRDIQILDNRFRATRDDVGENGVDVKRVQGPILVAGNIFRGFRPKNGKIHDASGSAGEGMVVHIGAQNVTIERNRFSDCTIGLDVKLNAKRPEPIRAIVVRHNLFTDHLLAGVRVLNVHSIEITRNTFAANAHDLIVNDTPAADGSLIVARNLFTSPVPAGFPRHPDNAHLLPEKAGFVDYVGRDLRLIRPEEFGAADIAP